MLESNQLISRNYFLDFFLPRFCLCCEKKLPHNIKAICSECSDELINVDEERLGFEFNKKFADENIIDDLLSLYLFQVDGNIQTLLHELKYNNKFGVGKLLGKQIAAQLGEKINLHKIDLVIPMPLHKLKKAERGFNQADFVADGMSKELGIKLCRGCVVRRKFTKSQTKLNIDERKRNVKGAFRIKKPKHVAGKNILILDDVITTGASVSEVGRLLKENKASQVIACSVALAD